MSEMPQNPQMQNQLELALAARIRRRRTLSMVMLGLAIFIFGGLAGWAMTILVGPFHPRPETMPPDPPVPVLVDQLRHELLLSDEQVQQVTKIYEQREAALKTIRQTIEPQLKTQYDGLRDQMKLVLNSAQFERWDNRFETVRNHMLPPPPPPDGPGGFDGGRGGGRGDDRGFGPTPGGRGPDGERGGNGPPRGGPPPFGGPRGDGPPPMQ